MKPSYKPKEEKALIGDPKYLTCFLVGLAFGIVLTLFFIVIIKGYKGG